MVLRLVEFGLLFWIGFADGCLVYECARTVLVCVVSFVIC